jgi:hypothetical protein
MNTIIDALAQKNVYKIKLQKKLDIFLGVSTMNIIHCYSFSIAFLGIVTCCALFSLSLARSLTPEKEKGVLRKTLMDRAREV